MNNPVHHILPYQNGHILFYILRGYQLYISKFYPTFFCQGQLHIQMQSLENMIYMFWPFVGHHQADIK